MPGDIKQEDITADLKYVNATIANGTAISDAVDLKAHRIHHVILPAAMDGGEIGLQVSKDGITFVSLYSQTALYKLALSHEKLADAAKSKSILEDLVNRFPLSGEAHLARERLGATRRR